MNGARGRGTILVVEPHLKGQFGHPWRYALAFVERFAPLGWSLRVLAHRDYDGPATLGRMSVERVFFRSYYEVADCVREGSDLPREAAAQADETSTLSHFARTVLDQIERASQSADDVRILVPTATAGILAAGLVIPLLWRGALPTMALMFHEEPEFHADWYRPLNLKVLSVKLAGSGWGGRLRCFATDKKLAERLAALLGTNVQDIGDVFAEGEIARLLAVTRTPSFAGLASRERTFLETLIALQSAGTRIAWCPGPIRPDKGADALSGIVRAMGQNAAAFRLVLQTSPGKNLDDFAALGGDPCVIVVRDVFSEDAYRALLGVTDIVLLPYDPIAYARRVSRVFQEAVLAGRPIIATAGMSAESGEFGAAAVFLSDWSSWPSEALKMIELFAAPRHPARTEVADKFKRWHAMIDWLTSAPSGAVARPPVLYVHSSRQTKAEAERCRQDLQTMAARGFPVLELVAPSTHRNLLALQDRLAGSAAQLTTWTPPPAGVRRFMRKLRLDLMRACGRSHCAFEARMALPGLIEEIRDRHGFSLVIAAGRKDDEPAIRGCLGLPADVPVLLQDVIAEGDAQCCWARELDAALDRAASLRPARAARPVGGGYAR